VAAGGDRPLVFVTVGTDHHPFDRLVGWVDRWLEDGAEATVRCLVQSGTSRPPRRAEHARYLSYPDMEARMADALVVISHGGPGNVMMCRWSGKKPIVVPRRKELGEHVDDHQLAFTRRLGALGEIELAEDESTLRRVLDEVVGGERSLQLPPPETEAAAAIGRFERLVDGLLAGRA